MICFGCSLWHINQCTLFNAKCFLYIHIKYIYDLFWLGFMAYQPLYVIQCHIPFYTYILNIYDLVWLDFMAYQPLYVI